MWHGRRIEIGWTDCLKNEKVLQRVKEERNILHAIKCRKANYVGHILCRNCLIKHVVEGKIKGRIGMMENEEEDVSSYWTNLR
jgi:inosine/xanthosine triphosphate pyrophosphatase family protein